MTADELGWPWDVLDLTEATQDARSIRRAYARRLKTLDSEDVIAFQSLRQAYDVALAQSGAQPSGRALHVPIPRPAADPVCDLTNHAGVTPAPDAALLLRVDGLLAAKVYLPEDWMSVLASMTNAHGDTNLRIEHVLLQRIDDAGARTPPKAWIRILDRHFGWRQDGVRLRQRFGLLPIATQRIIEAQRASSAIPERPAIHAGLIKWWLGISVLYAVVKWLLPAA